VTALGSCKNLGPCFMREKALQGKPAKYPTTSRQDKRIFGVACELTCAATIHGTCVWNMNLYRCNLILLQSSFEHASVELFRREVTPYESGGPLRIIATRHMFVVQAKLLKETATPRNIMVGQPMLQRSNALGAVLEHHAPRISSRAIGHDRNLGCHLNKMLTSADTVEYEPER